MEITAQIIEGIKYKSFITNSLVQILLSDFNINSAKSFSLVLSEQNQFAVSKWVSPKRTRSYPYERIYNTFSVSNRITVIPVIKDEGAAGDRDFLQWDTLSLMSLLNVFVILAYYETAEAHRSRAEKITNQKLNNEYVLGKIKEIFDYHSSALHWNLKELKSIGAVVEKVKESYTEISERTLVRFHNSKGLDLFAAQINENLSMFMNSSRTKSRAAQSREFQTVQPKEILSSVTKAKITITNYLGGIYYFTVDEILIDGENLHLIESKHSGSGKIPSLGDIKDGLLKMMLYTNLENVKIGETSYPSLPVLRLTSAKLEGEISSNSSLENRERFYRLNKLNNRQTEMMQALFAEAAENNFVVSLGNI